MKISRNTFILSLISSVSLFACGDKKKKGEQTVVWNEMVALSATQAVGWHGGRGLARRSRAGR